MHSKPAVRSFCRPASARAKLTDLVCFEIKWVPLNALMFLDSGHQDISLNSDSQHKFLSGSQRIEACPSDVFRCRDLGHGFELWIHGTLVKSLEITSKH